MAQKPLKRRFTYVAGSSNKFWEVEVIEKTLITRWGRIGTGGQAQTEAYPSNALAVASAQEKCRGKIKKGYREEFLSRQNPPLIRAQDQQLNNPLKSKAQEALDLFQANKAAGILQQSGIKSPVRKPKQKSAEKKSASPPSTPTSTESSGTFVKPKRKVVI